MSLVFHALHLIKGKFLLLEKKISMTKKPKVTTIITLISYNILWIYLLHFIFMFIFKHTYNIMMTLKFNYIIMDLFLSFWVEWTVKHWNLTPHGSWTLPYTIICVQYKFSFERNLEENLLERKCSLNVISSIIRFYVRL